MHECRYGRVALVALSLVGCSADPSGGPSRRSVSTTAQPTFVGRSDAAAPTPDAPGTASAVPPTPALASSALGSTTALDDGERCAELRRVAGAADDLGALRTALAGEGARLGVSLGETFETGTRLVSFCVRAKPALSAGACVASLGMGRPVVHRALTKKTQWTVTSAPRHAGERMQAPRHGPAAILPMLDAPPHGKPTSYSDKSFPIHELAGSQDVINELCFVERTIGEAK